MIASLRRRKSGTYGRHDVAGYLSDTRLPLSALGPFAGLPLVGTKLDEAQQALKAAYLSLPDDQQRIVHRSGVQNGGFILGRDVDDALRGLPKKVAADPLADTTASTV